MHLNNMRLISIHRLNLSDYHIIYVIWRKIKIFIFHTLVL